MKNLAVSTFERRSSEFREFYDSELVRSPRLGVSRPAVVIGCSVPSSAIREIIAAHHHPDSVIGGYLRPSHHHPAEGDERRLVQNAQSAILHLKGEAVRKENPKFPFSALSLRER
jgi:hypothetical protein